MQMRQEAKYWKHLSIKCAPKQDHHKEQPLYLPWELVHHTKQLQRPQGLHGDNRCFYFSVDLSTFLLSTSDDSVVQNLTFKMCKTNACAP